MNTTSFKPQKQSNVLKYSLTGLATGVLTLGLVAAVRLAAAPEAEAHPRPQVVYDATGAMLTAIAPSRLQNLEVFVPVYDAAAAMWAAVPWLQP